MVMVVVLQEFHILILMMCQTAILLLYIHKGTLLKEKSHWNVGGWTLDSKIDDVGFISSLLTLCLKDIILINQNI